MQLMLIFLKDDLVIQNKDSIKIYPSQKASELYKM